MPTKIQGTRTALAVVFAVAAFSTPQVAGTAIGADEVADAAGERAAYGLPADSSIISAIVGSGLDVGTSQWGVVLTAAEAATLDIPGRMHFANEISEDLLPYVESLPEYGGSYLETSRGGGLVILLTQQAAEVVARIRELVPTANRGVRIETVERPWSQLMRAVDAAGEVWSDMTAPRWLSIGIETRANGLIMRVLQEDLRSAADHVPELASRLGVPVRVIEGEPERTLDHHCAVRYDCHNPSRAGSLLQNDYIGSNQFCSTGFHIVVNGDKQFMMAGHCGHNRPTDWYMSGYGQMGRVQASMFTSHDRDLMRVTMNDTHASNDIFGSSLQVTHSRIAITGETLCASLGKTNGFDCGVVEATWEQYWTDTCGACPVWGARIWWLAMVEGDSGSPIYSTQPYGTAIAVGLASTEIHFPHVKHGLDTWGATIIGP